MKDTIVRRLVPSDASQYRALMLEAYTLVPEAFTSSIEEREVLPVEWWADRMSSKIDATELVYGVFVGNELAGAAGLSLEQRKRTSHRATLFGMYVRHAARGIGIGRRLIEEVLSCAKRSGRIEIVQLTVSESNYAALQLYFRCGFEPFGTEPMAVKLGSEYINKVHMWQQIVVRSQ